MFFQGGVICAYPLFEKDCFISINSHYDKMILVHYYQGNFHICEAWISLRRLNIRVVSLNNDKLVFQRIECCSDELNILMCFAYTYRICTFRTNSYAVLGQKIAKFRYSNFHIWITPFKF